MKKRIKKISTRELIKYLGTLGFHIFSQEGSHVKLIQANNIKNNVTIPWRKELGQGTIDDVFHHIKHPIADFYQWLGVRNFNYQ